MNDSVKERTFRTTALQAVRVGLSLDCPQWKDLIGKRAADRHQLARLIRTRLLSPDPIDPKHRWFMDLQPMPLAKLLQCLEFDYRVEEDPSDEQVIESTNAFLDRQSRVGRFNPTLRIRDMAFMRTTVARILGKPPTYAQLSLQHGSGAVAEGLRGLDKWLGSVHLPRQVRAEFDPLWRLNWLSSQDRRSKFAVVPKDARGPRVIALEPSGSMLFQQGLMRYMYKRLKQAGFTLHDQDAHTRVMLRNFDEVATVDLKDASDFVSWRLVCLLFPKGWVKLLAELRTPFVVLPDGSCKRVHSAFLMGAALCFPVLTLVCYALSELSVRRADCPRIISVYGDDIIIHRGAYPYLIFALSSAGLVLNQDKTGRGGRMLETCGYDAVDQWNVRPVFLRKCSTENMAALLESLMDLQRSFFRRGYLATASNLMSLSDWVWYSISTRNCAVLRDMTWLDMYRVTPPTRVPRSHLDSVGTCTIPSTEQETVRRRFDRKTSMPVYLGLVLCDETRETNLAGSGALASALCNEGGTLTPKWEQGPSNPRMQHTWISNTSQVYPIKDLYHILGSAVTL